MECKLYNETTKNLNLQLALEASTQKKIIFSYTKCFGYFE